MNPRNSIHGANCACHLCESPVRKRITLHREPRRICPLFACALACLAIWAGLAGAIIWGAL